MHRPSDRSRNDLAPCCRSGRLRATAERIAVASSARTDRVVTTIPAMIIRSRHMAVSSALFPHANPHWRGQLARPRAASPEYGPIGSGHVVHADDPVVAAGFGHVNPSRAIGADA